MRNAGGAVEKHIETWSKALANQGHEWWPKFVYHFTDVRNAAKALELGKLYSRARAAALMQNDNAAQAVIANTSDAHKSLVRLYMRPRTPTQYCNEGIRPPGHRYQGAHCPVPIFFCFDAKAILTREDALCSNGNMARAGAAYSDSLEHFQSIPFGQVFHDGPLPTVSNPPLADEIKNRRHTEVLIPGELALGDSLKMIACRSPAERQTLLALLGPKDAARWSTRTVVGVEGFFQKDWTYVESVSVVDRSTVVFNLHPGTLPDILYQMRFEYDAGSIWSWRGTMKGTQLRLNLAEAISRGLTKGAVRLYIEEALAFASVLPFNEVPF